MTDCGTELDKSSAGDSIDVEVARNLSPKRRRKEQEAGVASLFERHIGADGEVQGLVELQRSVSFLFQETDLHISEGGDVQTFPFALSLRRP